jgi:hypothetical protein
MVLKIDESRAFRVGTRRAQQGDRLRLVFWDGMEIDVVWSADEQLFLADMAMAPRVLQQQADHARQVAREYHAAEQRACDDDELSIQVHLVFDPHSRSIGQYVRFILSHDGLTMHTWYAPPPVTDVVVPL